MAVDGNLRVVKDSYIFVLRLTLFALAGDILLTHGFMLLRIPPVGPGVPINEVLLAFDLVAIIFMQHSRVGFSDTPVMLPLALLWMQATVQLLIGLSVGGIWAIRDAANLIETGFLFVGYWLASDARFVAIFSLWFRRVLTFAAFYILLYPLQDSLVRYSPVIPSMSGYDAPLFFSYGDPSSIAVTAACQMIVSNYGRQLYRVLFTGALVMVLIVFVQARLAYFQLAFLLLIVLFFRPQRLSSLGTMVFATAVLMGLFLASGIELPGRLGTTFTLDFLVNHFAAIWGGGGHDASTSAAAEGVDLRLGWWTKIHNDLQRDLPTWMFGLGYGIPLTSFHGPTDDIVREPHNSLFSIYGRLGVLGLINFIIVQVILIVTAVRFILLAKRSGSTELHGLAITVLCFLGVHLIYSAGEGGFELSFIAAPYYFIAGAVLALTKSLVRRETAFVPDPLTTRRLNAETPIAAGSR
jgi:O-Antigen ligase